MLLVLALGTSAMMLGMAGFGEAWGADPPPSPAKESVNGSADQVGPTNEPISGPVTTGESSIVGLIITGLFQVSRLAAKVVLLPVTLMELGFPAWFAIPIGSLAEGIVGIGLIQFATKRKWE